MTRLIVSLAVVTVLLAGLGIHVASRAPDGLERASLELQLSTAPTPGATAVPRAPLTRSAVVLLGCAAALVLSLLLGRTAARRRPPPPGA